MSLLLRNTLRNPHWQVASSREFGNSCDTKETDLSVVQNEIMVHIKWVKQATECICIPVFGSAAQRRCWHGFCSKCKTSPWPNDPKTISSEWIALQTSFVILYHPVCKAPFNQQNQEPRVYYSRFKTSPDCCAIWSGFGCPVRSDRASTVCSSRVKAEHFWVICAGILHYHWRNYRADQQIDTLLKY